MQQTLSRRQVKISSSNVARLGRQEALWKVIVRTSIYLLFHKSKKSMAKKVKIMVEFLNIIKISSMKSLKL